MYGELSVRLRTRRRFLLVVVEVLAAEGALAEVFAEVRGVRAAAAVADDEHGPAMFVAVVNGVGQGVDLGRVESHQFLADAFHETAERPAWFRAFFYLRGWEQ